jgi:hypothetical protein
LGFDGALRATGGNMTSLSVSYKGFLILAQAELVGRGGVRVSARERHYVPLAVVARAVGPDKEPPELKLFRARGQDPMPNPYGAMMAALQYAKDLVDVMAARPAIDGASAVGEFDWGGAHWRWDSLNVAHCAALTQTPNETR